MRRLLGNGKRIVAMLMVALLVLGLMPVSPVVYSAGPEAGGEPTTPVANTLTINMDADKADIKVIEVDDRGVKVGDPLSDTDAENDDKFVYAVADGKTYTVSFTGKTVDDVAEVVYGIYNNNTKVALEEDGTLKVAPVENANAFEYDVIFVSETATVTVSALVSDFTNVGLDGALDVSTDESGYEYTVVAGKDYTLTAKHNVSLAGVGATINGNSLLDSDISKNDETGVCSFSLGTITADTIIALSTIYEVTITNTLENGLVKLFASAGNQITNDGTSSKYIVEKGNAYYITVDSSEKLVVKVGGIVIADSDGNDTDTVHKYELGTINGSVDVEIFVPTITITYPKDKITVDKITLFDNQNSNNTVSDSSDEEGKAVFKVEPAGTYSVVFTTVDADAIVKAEDINVTDQSGNPLQYEVTVVENGNGERIFTIANITANVGVNISVANQYTVTVDATEGGSIKNGDYVIANTILVNESSNSLTLDICPLETHYISALQVKKGAGNYTDVTIDTNKLNLTDRSYELVLENITEDTEVKVVYSPLAQDKDITDVMNITVGDGSCSNMIKTDNSIAYYLGFIDANTLNDIKFVPESGTKVKVGETWSDSIVIDKNSSLENNAYTIESVMLYKESTTFTTGMFMQANFVKPVTVVIDETLPTITVDADTTTKFFGPNKNDIVINGTVSDTNLDRVVYFTTEPANKDAILGENVSIATVNTDGTYSIQGTSSATQDVTYYVYAIDKALNYTALAPVVVEFDNTAPTNGTITIKNITTFLDFMFVQVPEIEITVDNVTDEAGIEEIKVFLYDKDGNEVPNNNNNVASLVDGKYVINFNTGITYGEKHTFKIQSKDTLGNVGTLYTATVIINNHTFTELVYDGTAPVVTVNPDINAHTSGVYKDTSKTNTYYISQKVFDDGFVFNISALDEVSGLESVTVNVNGRIISLGDTTVPGTSIGYENATDTVNDGTYTINLKNLGFTDTNAYTISVTAQDQAGNASTLITYTVYVDSAAPTFADIIVNGTVAQKGDFQSYKFFTNDKFVIEYGAMDGSNTDLDSKIQRYVIEYVEGTTVVKTEEVQGNEIRFNKEFADNFKGTIRVTVYDNVGNNATVTLADGLICEKENTHATNAGVTLTTPETDMKDINGVKLYADNTSVSVVVTDTYAGINNIVWSVVAPFDTANNASGSMTMNALAAGWTAEATDNGVVTKVAGTIPVTNNSNNIVVTVTITDNVGNVSSSNVVVSIDKTTPVINISVAGDDADTQYTDTFNGNRVATITIRERNFNVANASVVITNTDNIIPGVTAWTKTEDSSNPDNNVYTATVTFSADGDYTLNVAFTDLAKRAATSAQHALTIDKTVPVSSVSISGNAVNGFYFATDRTATIVIEEHNFDPSRVQLTGTATNDGATVAVPTLGSWSSSGNTHTATVYFSADADYQLRLTGVDKAGNTFTYEVPNFVIDKQVPEISITGVENQSANAGNVIPVITLGDVNYDTNGVNITLVGANNGTMELDGTFSDSANGQVFTFNNFPNEQSYDDIYTLTATKTDMAGNETTETITFSVNRFGSVYTLSDELKTVIGKYVKEPFSIVLTETNIDRLDPETIKVVLTINGTPKTLVLNEDYTISETGSDASWKQYVYTINPDVFEGDGSYSVAIYSVDSAGNVNENINEVKEAEVIFGIDATAPIIEAINFEADRTYENTFTATVSAIDNIILSSVKVLINGEEVEVTEENGIYSFTMPESAEAMNVVVIATDSAGNETSVEYADIWVTSNMFIRFINNPVAVAAAVAGVATVGGGTGAFVFFRKRNVIKVKK